MVERWDNPPIESVIPPISPLNNNVEPPTDRKAAFMFLLWSVFMMLLGAGIELMWQGHIVFR